MWGQSSWINYWQERDEDLWSETDALTNEQPALS